MHENLQLENNKNRADMETTVDYLNREQFNNIKHLNNYFYEIADKLEIGRVMTYK